MAVQNNETSPFIEMQNNAYVRPQMQTNNLNHLGCNNDYDADIVVDNVCVENVMPLTMFSYNSQGLGVQKVKFMQDLFSTCGAGIISLQETLALRNNSYKISNAFLDYESYIIPATKSCLLYTSPSPRDS